MKYENVEIPDTYKIGASSNVAAILLWIGLPIVILLDIGVSLANISSSRLAGTPKLDRSKYIKPWSRFNVPGIPLFRKMGCVYCSYANGVAYFFRDFAMSAEFLYCPWKQKDRTRISHHKIFNDW